MLGAQASGAQVKMFKLTIYRYCGRVYIRYPAAVGTPFRMADVMTELGGLTAQITLQSNCSFDCLANLV